MREFRKQGKYWSIWFEAPPGKPPITIGIASGEMRDGKRVQLSKQKDVHKARGRPNTKAFMSAMEVAAFEMDRAIEKTLRLGYTEVGLDGRPLVGGPLVMTIDYNQRLPHTLRFCEPTPVDPEQLRDLDEAGDLLLAHLPVGEMVIAHINYGGMVDLYTNEMKPLTYHFPHLVRALGPEGMCLPPNGVMLFIAHLGDGDDPDSLIPLHEMMNSLPNKAVELQGKYGAAKFYLHRLPIWKKVNRELEQTLEVQCYTIENGLAERFIGWRDDTMANHERILYAIENIDDGLDAALAEAKKVGSGRLLGFQRSAVLGEDSFNFDGKAKMPPGYFATGWTG